MTLTPRFRLWSALEFILGAAVVILHNVYRLLPNEVPILFVAGWISIRFRNGGWRAVGLARPASWTWTVAIAAGVAALRLTLGELVLPKLLARFFPPERVTEAAEMVKGNARTALLGLLIIWTFAAFGEELSYRGYLLNRAAEIGGRSRVAWVLALIAVSVLFGYGHYYKGPAGIIDSGMAGLLLGGAYLLTRRNLWVAVLAHGLIDTVAVIAAYLGAE